VPPQERLTAQGSFNSEEGQRSAREFRRGVPEDGVTRRPLLFKQCTRVHLDEPWRRSSSLIGDEMQCDPIRNISGSIIRSDADGRQSTDVLPRSIGLERLLLRSSAISRAARKFKELRTQPRFTEENGRKVAHTVDGQQFTGVEFDIPEDSYGAAILAIVKEMQEAYYGHGTDSINLVKCAFALLLLAVNLVLQFCILTFIASHVVQPAVHRIQKDYFEFHQRAFNEDGVFQPGMWRHYDRKDELCQIGMTSRFFYCVLLFVWVTSMLGELRASAQLIYQVTQMPLCQQGQEMLRMDETSTISIVALTRKTQVLLYCLVCLPKIGISLYLLVLGCQWLSATTSFEALVVNCMAMEFVLHVDELLYEAFLPTSYRRQVADINFFMLKRHETRQELEQREWSTYVKAFSFLLAGLAVVVLWSGFLQGVLPQDISDVKEHCDLYLKNLTPICGMWGFQSFRSCYPFGNRDLDQIT